MFLQPLDSDLLHRRIAKLAPGLFDPEASNGAFEHAEEAVSEAGRLPELALRQIVIITVAATWRSKLAATKPD